MAFDVRFLRDLQTAYDTLNPKSNKDFYYTTDDGNVYLGAHQLNNDALNVNDFTIATQSGSIVTLSGIKELGGKIAKSTDSTKDISLAPIATTGNSKDVSYSGVIGSSSVSNVKAAIDALIAASGDGVASKTVYVTDNTSTTGTDYATIYKIYQGSNGSVATPDENELIGTINIPKDQFVDDAELVDITYNSTDGKLYDGATDVTDLIVGPSGTASAADAGRYFKLVFEIQDGTAGKSTIYINVKSLVNIYTSGSAASDEIVIAIDPNTYQVTASIGTNGIAAAKITITDTAGYFLSSDIEGALAEVGLAIASMDAVVDATKTAINGSIARVVTTDAIPVLQGLTQEDGKLVSMNVVEAAQIGTGTGRSGSGTAQDPYVYDNTIIGAKKYTTDKIAELSTAIEHLDVTEFPLTSMDSGSIITIHGIKEEDGKIAVGTNPNNDITLAKIAATGQAGDVELSSATSAKFTSGTTDVDDALSQLATALTWGSIT